MTEEEKDEVVARVLEEVRNAARHSHLNPNVLPKHDVLDADEFARRLSLAITKTRGS